MSRTGITSSLGALFATSLVAVSLAGGVAFAAPSGNSTDAIGKPSEKVETVTATTDASGAVESVEVEVTLKNDDALSTLADSTNLIDIESDDFDFKGESSALIWQAGGKDVVYSGTSRQDLPVSIKVTYQLNGEKIAPEDLAGKSGKVSIRYDYYNASSAFASIRGQASEISTPFTCITALMFDSKNFKNISTENGKVIEDGDDIIVAGLAMPGLKGSLGSMAEDYDIPDYFEVTADVENFEMSQGMTIVTAGLLSELDTKRMGFGDMDEASHAMSEAMSQLLDGAGQLADGMDALSEGAGQMREGTSALASGASTLEQNLYVLAYGTADNPGLPGAYDGAAGLVAALKSLQDPLAVVADSSTGLPAAAKQLDTLAASLPNRNQADDLKAAINSESSGLSADQKASLSALLDAAPQVADASAAVSQFAQQLPTLSESYSQIVTSAESLPAGIAQAVEAAKLLYQGSHGLTDGASQLSQATSQFESGTQAAADGASALRDGMDAFKSEGVDELVKVVDDDIGGLQERLDALSDSSESYDNFSGKEAGVKSSVRFVYETAAIEVDDE